MVNNVFISAVTTDNLSRKEAVAWVNDTLKSHLTKVEEMSTGAAYCQLTHVLFRDAINLKKVKFNPRSEPDILSNWKLLTTSWKTLGVDKPVDVEKMKKGKFQDNMEFLQWFYKFFNANLNENVDEYDAVGARNGEDLPALKGPGGVARPAAPAARPVAVTRPAPARTAAPTNGVAPVSARVAPVPAATSSKTAPASNAEVLRLTREVDELRNNLLEQEEQCNSWIENAKAMEQERDHYYALLRKFETLMTEVEENGSPTIEISALKKVLYEGSEEEEEEEEEVTGQAEEAIAQDDSETF